MKDDDFLDLQVAYVVLSALQSAAPLEHLAGRTQHHNLVECKSGSAGPCSFLLCFSNPAIHFTRNTAEHKQQPTLYLAISATSSALACPSLLSNFLCGQHLLDTGLAPGAKVQAAAAQVIAEMPVQLLLNYLGQGFKLVLAGQCFGGLVAHTLAARLLLQVQQEITLAQKMGINLSALSQTKDKVISFGFGVPFFAGSQLQQCLHESQLDQNLHSFWHHGDGSIPFLTYASELAAADQQHYADQGGGEEDEEPDTFGGDELGGTDQGPSLQLALGPGPHTAALDQCAATLGQALESLQSTRKIPAIVCSCSEGSIYNAAMACHRAHQLTKGGPGSRSFNSQDEVSWSLSMDSPKSLSKRDSHTELFMLSATPEFSFPTRSMDRRSSQTLKPSPSKEFEGAPLKPAHSRRASSLRDAEGFALKASQSIRPSPSKGMDSFSLPKPPQPMRPSPFKDVEGPPLASSRSMGPSITGRDSAHHSSPLPVKIGVPAQRTSSIAHVPVNARAPGADAAQRRQVLNMPPAGHASPTQAHSGHTAHRSVHRDPTGKARVSSSSGTGGALGSELEPRFGRMSMSEAEKHAKLRPTGASIDEAHPRSSRHSLPQLPTSSPSSRSSLPQLPASSLKAAAGTGTKKAAGSEAQGNMTKQPNEATTSPWRHTLDAFLEHAPTKLDHHVPIGHFWIIEQQSDSHSSSKSPKSPSAHGQAAASKPAADAKYAGPEPLVKLKKVAPSEVMEIAAKWLLPSNRELLELWEQSLAELEKDLMEVFPWFVFASTITANDSSIVPRQKAVKLTALQA